MTSLLSVAQLPPVVTCWQQNTTENGFADELTNVQAVNYSDTYVYVRTEDIPLWILSFMTGRTIRGSRCR